LSNFYGKSNQFAFTISSNQSNANLATLATNAGWNGTSKVVATVASNVYVFSTSTGTPALTIPNSFPNGVDLINNGNICGRGGDGGIQNAVGAAGGIAINILTNVSITNNSYIAGGGGGGGGGQASSSYNDYGTVFQAIAYAGGGGGSGGGTGGAASSVSGGAAGTPTSTTGGNGSNVLLSSGQVTQRASSGGGGGFGLPGTGGAARSGMFDFGVGGTAGGSGGRTRAGGDIFTQVDSTAAGGGGGGWGAAGGLGGGAGGANRPEITSGAGGSAGNAGGDRSGAGMTSVSGGAGGRAVNLNGFSVTWVATGTRYGAIA